MVLNSYDLELLSYGPQFIPTPKWESKVVQKQKENLLKHIRAVEWTDVFINKDENDDINQNYYNINKKLAIPKFSRAEKNQITKNTETYIHIVKNKFRNLKPDVINMHKLRNKLNKNLQNSLRKLRNKTKNREIVIRNSDKDGKTDLLVLNTVNQY